MDRKVAIYIRVSTVHQIDKDSIPMQRADLTAYSELILNTDNYEIFEDAGYSGKNTDRPGFQAMMSRVRRGEFTHVLVWKIDRISRNLLDFSGMYQELKELGVTFVSKSEQFDTSTAMGEAMLKIILVFAELERNMTSERVTATMISRAGTGQWNGGRVPYGYTHDSETDEFHICPEEAEVVRMIHDMYEANNSLVYLARYLNDNQIYTKRRYEWTPTSVQIILKSKFYCGDYQYNKFKGGGRQIRKDESEWVTVENHHEALISRDQKERIISMLDSHKRNSKERGMRESVNIHIFKGLIHCGNCGKFFNCSVANKTKNPRYSTYFCPTRRKSTLQCNNKGTSDITLGEFVMNFILNLINVQKHWSSTKSSAELNAELLTGNSLSSVERISDDSLDEISSLLSSGLQGNFFEYSRSPVQSNADKSSLLAKKRKLERALDRLRNLFLYSDDAMTEREYLTEQSRICNDLDAVNDELDSIEYNEAAITDADFIAKASYFIIAQSLKDRRYISYKRLASSVDSSVLRDFIFSIIDIIEFTSGKVTSITFRNGLYVEFIHKK